MLSTLAIMIVFVTVVTLLARRGLPTGQPRSPIEPMRVRRTLAPGGDAPERPGRRVAAQEDDAVEAVAPPRSREATLEALMEEFAAGRISIEEYEQSLDRLYRKGSA